MSSEQNPVAWLRAQVDADHYRYEWVITQDASGAVAFEEEQVTEARDRVADCEAKLAILHEYELRDEDVALMLGPDTRRQREWDGLRLAVRLLLGAYRHREGYRPEWQTVHGFSLGTMLPRPSTGRVEFLPEAVTPAFAAIKEGDIVTMDGRDWRVAHRSEDPDGGIELDLVDADAPPEGVVLQGGVEIEGRYPEDKI